MKDLEFKFTEGCIALITYRHITLCCDVCHNKSTSAYECAWGGGYEYEPAVLCKEHLVQAVKELNEIIDKL